MDNASVRLFFALWPPLELQAKLAAWARRAAGGGRAMRRENIHLTLAFLGATNPALLPELIALAGSVRFDPLCLPLDCIGYWKHNRIIWCGAAIEPPALASLVEDLRARLSAAGIGYDRKAFVAHVTVVRKALGMDAAPSWIPLAWDVREFVLVCSRASEGRVTYEVMRRFPAAAG
jgi:RNA 2',3'-cyclic 3'-phosphodiesterase